MTYQIKHNNSGWYYDILDGNGVEIGCNAYFKTYDAAKLAVECAISKIVESGTCADCGNQIYEDHAYCYEHLILETRG